MFDEEKQEYYCDIEGCSWRGKSWWKMQWHYFIHGMKHDELPGKKD